MRPAKLPVLAFLLALAVPGTGSAQTPAAKVTITGLVDNLTSWTSNLSAVDLNYRKASDTEWYARTRVRPDITAEMGTTKFVLGLEIDGLWGQTGGADTTASGGAPQRTGVTGGWDLNTDTIGQIEVKWAYTEFTVPLVPWTTRLRLGAQPFTTTLKPGILATGDFAGVHLTTTLTRAARAHLTWAQVEEAATGPSDGFIRGEDYAAIASVEVTPVEGVTLRPIYALFVASGATSGVARQGRGGLGTGVANYPLGNVEWRHTAGLDARWRSGPFFVEPTALYQWGAREVTPSAPFTALGRREQNRRAGLADLRAGWRSGPLLVESAVVYATGNRAGEDVRSPVQTVDYFEPIDTDQGFLVGWAEIFAKGIEDNINVLYATAAGLNPSVGPSFDKYGIVRVAGRASYALTPAFTARAAVNANWTAEAVDTSGTLAAATGLTPGDFRGDSRFLGVELNLGAQWRLAPGLALDLVAAYLRAGGALSQATATAGTGAVRGARGPQDVQTLVARLRYSF